MACPSIPRTNWPLPSEAMLVSGGHLPKPLEGSAYIACCDKNGITRNFQSSPLSALLEGGEGNNNKIMVIVKAHFDKSSQTISFLTSQTLGHNLPRLQK